MDPVDGGGGSRQFHNLPNTGEPAQVVNTYTEEMLYREDVIGSCFP